MNCFTTPNRVKKYNDNKKFEFGNITEFDVISLEQKKLLLEQERNRILKKQYSVNEAIRIIKDYNPNSKLTISQNVNKVFFEKKLIEEAKRIESIRLKQIENEIADLDSQINSMNTKLENQKTKPIEPKSMEQKYEEFTLELNNTDNYIAEDAYSRFSSFSGFDFNLKKQEFYKYSPKKLQSFQDVKNFINSDPYFSNFRANSGYIENAINKRLGMLYETLDKEYFSLLNKKDFTSQELNRIIDSQYNVGTNFFNSIDNIDFRFFTEKDIKIVYEKYQRFIDSENIDEKVKKIFRNEQKKIISKFYLEIVNNRILAETALTDVISHGTTWDVLKNTIKNDDHLYSYGTIKQLGLENKHVKFTGDKPGDNPYIFFFKERISGYGANADYGRQGYCNFYANVAEKFQSNKVFNEKFGEMTFTNNVPKGDFPEYTVFANEMNHFMQMSTKDDLVPFMSDELFDKEILPVLIDKYFELNKTSGAKNLPTKEEIRETLLRNKYSLPRMIVYPLNDFKINGRWDPEGLYNYVQSKLLQYRDNSFLRTPEKGGFKKSGQMLYFVSDSVRAGTE